MPRQFHKLFVSMMVVGLLLALQVPSVAEFQLTYATELLSVTPPEFESEALNLLDPHTLDAAEIGDTETVTLGGFSNTVIHDNDSVATLLELINNVNQPEVDFVALDDHGFFAAIFEQAVWIFSDGINTVTTKNASSDMAGNDPDNVILENSFFSDPVNSGEFIGYLLFDFPDTLNLNSSNFSVQIQGTTGFGGSGVPDVLLFARTNIPEPSTILILAVGSLTMLRHRRS